MTLATLLLVLATGASDPALPSGDTIRVEIGSKAVDGRVYAEHAARVRTWVGPGEGTMRSEWTNVLRHGDSAGRKVHRWVTTGVQTTATGEKVRWELKQTYDAITLQPYGMHREASNGTFYRLRIDGGKVTGTRRTTPNGPEEPVSYNVDRLGYVASASDLVPAAVGFKEGRVIIAPIWGPGMTKAETRVFKILGKVDVNVEGTMVNAWKVEEHREADGSWVANWYLLDKSPYMVYGEVPLPDGSVQRMSEIELPMPNK